MSNKNVVTFRAKGANENRVAMARELGIDVTEVLNELLEKYGDSAIKCRVDALRKKMERAKGFEPSTFTLAR